MRTSIPRTLPTRTLTRTLSTLARTQFLVVGKVPARSRSRLHADTA